LGLRGIKTDEYLYDEISEAGIVPLRLEILGDVI